MRNEEKCIYFGGNIWESNPSGTGLAPHTGFEDQEAHRHLSAPSESIAEIDCFVNFLLLFTGNVPRDVVNSNNFLYSLLTKRGQIK